MERIKYHYIYKITNTITNRFYVGMHSTFKLNDGYFGSGKILKRSIKKYGIDKHVKEIIHYADTREALVYQEKQLITEEFLQNPLVMNIRLGGEGGGGWTRQQQQENNRRGQLSMQKMWEENGEWAQRRRDQSKHLFDRLRSEGRIPKPKPHQVGSFKHTIETKRKIGEFNSQRQQGSNNSQYGTCWIYHPETFINKKINKGEMDTWVQQGWCKGRKTR